MKNKAIKNADMKLAKKTKNKASKKSNKLAKKKQTKIATSKTKLAKNIPIHKQFKITLKQHKFCNNYLGYNGNNMFGNGTLSYCQAYDRPMTASARVNASECLTKSNVLNYIAYELQHFTMTDESVDNEHNFLIKQHDSKMVKLGAIKEYNRLKNRINEGINVSFSGDITVTNYSKGTKTPPKDKQ